jgi:multiple sugar transport system substrate-binding protein
LATISLLLTACGTAATPAPTTGPVVTPGATAATTPAPVVTPGATVATTPAPVVTPEATPAETAPPSASGPVTLSGWQSSGAEGNAVTQTLLSAQATLPDIQINYAPLAGDYAAAMAANFAAHDVPDIFYVDAGYAQEWSREGFLMPLDDMIAASGFDTSAFFPAALSVFKGADGKTYGFPKDFNTIAMAYNTDIVTAPPKTMDELMTWAEGAKGSGSLQAPICLNPGLDRGLAFVYANGGSLLTDDGSASAIQTDASKAAVQWYMDLFKKGLGMTASDMGDGWCGEALGKGDAAVIFEGGWLDPYIPSTFPDVKYAWADVPTGTSGEPVTISYTASYAIGADSKNPDGGFALMQYLTGPEGMTKWTEGGVALPSRSDVPIPAGKDVLAGESSFAKPGSGFMPGYNEVQKAFQDAFINEIQTESWDAGVVVDATKTAIDTALAGQ